MIAVISIITIRARIHSIHLPLFAATYQFLSDFPKLRDLPNFNLNKNGVCTQRCIPINSYRFRTLPLNQEFVDKPILDHCPALVPPITGWLSVRTLSWKGEVKPVVGLRRHPLI
jgi:hypothetical protein